MRDSPSPRKRRIFDDDQEERMIYGHREVDEFVRTKAKTLTIVDAIQKREIKKNKSKVIPTL